MASRFLASESQVRTLFNKESGTTADKKILKVGSMGASHEFDIYQDNKVIGGITTSPWLNRTGSNNSGGQDRASAELLWLSLWEGNERRVMILTDRDMAERLFGRWKGCSFPNKIEIIYCNLTKRQFDIVGTL